MSKRTLFLIFALFVIAFVLLMTAFYKPSTKPSLPTQTLPTPKIALEQTILAFGEPVVTISSSASKLEYSLPINITTGTNSVTAVQLELQYDSSVLTNVSIIPGTFFNNPVALLNKIDLKTGRISYAFGISPSDSGIKGSGVVANLIFETNAGIPQQTSILFLPKTLVTAEGITQSVLRATNNIELIVGEKTSTPSAPPISPLNQ